MRVDRTALERLLPHQSAMCLLDAVHAHDHATIRCGATSHRSPANPLRIGGRLPALAAIEYAAQAMAAHGALRADRPARRGMLVAARAIRLHVRSLETIAGDLEIAAECLAADANGLVYRFAVTAAGEPVADGRATIALGST